MPTTTAPPILIWQPEGGIPGGSPISNPPVYSQADVTQLIEGQAYVDVVFGSIQTTEDWVLVACEVENTTDFEPLNIWPGIITDRTAAGFRLQLNGMPDSDSYYLHWAVSGVNILPVPATLYLFTGPTSGAFGVNLPFTVKLPPSTTLGAPVTITPNDGGIGGSFTPSSVVLSSGVATATFVYNAVAYGPATISVTNSGTLIDPASIVFTSIAPIYTFTGPSTGDVGVASTNFTVQIGADAVLAVPTTVTPHDGGAGGTFTPTTVLLVAGVPLHFTYTPASGGAKTLSVTNNGGLVDPANLTYTVTATLVDGDPVSTWRDSSVNGNNATQTGSSRPIYKTAIIGGKPAVRFLVAGTSGLNLTTPINAGAPWTVFAVMQQIGGTSVVLHTLACSTANSPLALTLNSDGNIYMFDKTNIKFLTNTFSGAFHVYSGNMTGGGTDLLYVDGTSQTISPSSSASAHDFDNLGWRAFTPEYSAGYIAELIFYSTSLSGTDRANIEKYLGTKYGITVAGGSAVQPDTVTGLKGWWKADSL